MTEATAATRSVIVEREIMHPAEKIWRALTVPHLVADWLMKGDVAAVAGHRFRFGAEWGDVDCEVIEVEAQRVLAYSWAGKGLESVVTWTLTPTPTGTLLRMEQTGFQPDQQLAYHGARAGWPRFMGRLEQVLVQMD